MQKPITAKRTLFVFCISFFAAGILTAGIPFRIKLLIIPFCILLILSAILLCKVTKRRGLVFHTAVLIVLPIMASTVFLHVTAEYKIASCKQYDGVCDTVRVTIEDVRYSSSYYGYYTAQVSEGQTVPDMTVSLGIPDGSCDIGDTFRGEVTFRTLEGSTSFDESTYFIPDGILMCAEADSLEFEGTEDTFSFTEYFKYLNRRLTARIRAASGDTTLAPAVLLGRSDLLEASVKRDFGRIGISHLLAVSGLHLSVAVTALEFLLEKTSLHGRGKTLSLCLGIVFAMALVGFTKSVTRAGLMHLIRYSGQLLGRRSDGLTNLGTAAVIIIIFDPFAVYDTGFILSVLACYACIVYYRHIKNRTPAENKLKAVLQGILDTVKLTLLIMGLTLPVMWKVFGKLSLVSPLTNVVFIPAVTLFIYLSLTYTVLCGIPWANVILVPVLLTAEDIIKSLAEKLSRIPGIEVSLKGTAVGISAAAVFISVLIATFIYKKRRITSVITVSVSALGLIFCIIFGQMSNAASAEAEFVTLGKSEGFSIRCGNSYVLVDVSDGSAGFSRELTFAAEKRGATELSALVLTHLHRRHIASVTALADNIMVRLAVIPEAVTDGDTEVSQALCDIFEKRRIPYVIYSREDGTVTVNGVTLTSLGFNTLSRSTHPIVGFSITFAHKRIVYLGSSFGEKNELPLEVMTADTVFLGAHPPVRKLPVTVVTDGAAVLTYAANERGMLKVTAQGNAITLDEDAVYYIGCFDR